MGTILNAYCEKCGFEKDSYRLFCFFDEGKIIVLANGFQKKSQKTPKQEIEKALKIKKEYEREKK